jgi:Toprim-like
VQTLTAAQRTFCAQAVTQYQSDLAADTSAQAYVTGRLGPQGAATYRLGVVRRPLPGHEAYTGRLAIPYLTPAGPVSLRFRCLQAHICSETVLWTDKKGAPHYCPKYLSLDGAEGNLFNVLDLRRDSPFICVAEGEIDTMTLSLCGLPAVGVPGVKTWKDHFSRLLEDYDTVFAFGDGDEAGGKFSSFLAREARARPISLPRGFDVNDLFRERGAAGVRALIDT